MNLKLSSGVPELEEYNLLVDKKPHTVKLSKSGEKKVSKAEVDGKLVKVDFLEDICYGKPIFININGKLYKAELDRANAGIALTVRVDGISYEVQIENKNQAVSQMANHGLPAAKKEISETEDFHEVVISAPMPGKVTLFRVKAGDKVRIGDVLLVLESMKMENEILSPATGIVKEAKVSEGDAVNLGETIVVISEV